MISQQHENLLATKDFTRRRLYQALGFDGVESVTPVYASLASWKNPQTMKERSILFMGFHPHSAALNIPGTDIDPGILKQPDVVLFDVASRPEYGAVEELLNQGRPLKTEVRNHKVEVGGLFSLGTSFGIDGTIMGSRETYLRVFPSHRPGLIHFGLIRLKAGVDGDEIRSRINAALPHDVKVLTLDQLIQKEKDHWARNTPIGFVITMTMIIGLIVGSVILYQILYTDINEHLKEFATLKAIGYADVDLYRVVLVQALLLALIAYPLAWAVSAGLYALTHHATLLPISMTWTRTLQILLLTFFMCSASGLLAMQKLRAADPAEVF
jgi:putative ABC transport system permease protein